LLEEAGVIEKQVHAQNYTYGNVENGDPKVFAQRVENVD
jgi:hypothetical protein